MGQKLTMRTLLTHCLSVESTIGGGNFQEPRMSTNMLTR